MRLIQAAVDKGGRPLEAVEHGAGSVRSPSRPQTCYGMVSAYRHLDSPFREQGLFTQLLTAPPEGYPTIPLKRLTALEPSASMREAFDDAVLPGAKERGVDIRCLDGTFTAFPEEVADGTVDCLIIAQCVSSVGRALPWKSTT